MEKYDLHVHNHYDADATSNMTIEKIIRVCKEKEIDGIGIVLHYHQFLSSGYFQAYHDVTSIETFNKFLSEVKEAKSIFNIKVGVETEIMNIDGTLNALPEIIDRVDYVMPSVHFLPKSLLPFNDNLRDRLHNVSKMKYYQSSDWQNKIEREGREKIIKNYFKMRSNVLHSEFQDKIIVLPHPYHGFLLRYEIISSFEEIKDELNHLAEEMLETSTAFEVSEHIARRILQPMSERPPLDEYNIDPQSYETYKVWFNICAETGVKFIPGSDAHHTIEDSPDPIELLGNIEHSLRLIKKLNIPLEQMFTPNH